MDEVQSVEVSPKIPPCFTDVQAVGLRTLSLGLGCLFRQP